MTDDIIESYIDLMILERLLSEYDLTVTLIPKNGRFGNDASFDDICMMLSPALMEFKENGKLKLNSKGPLMAAANLRKLSKEHAMIILNSNALMLKGCRISEMFNGGINADTYVAYSVVRKVSEKVTGFTAESNTSLLFHLHPGEYAFWGVGGCEEIFSMERAFSNIKEHFCKDYTKEEALKRVDSIKSIMDKYDRDKQPLYHEIEHLTANL